MGQDFKWTLTHWIILLVIAFVITVAIMLVRHQEIVACDRGDHSYHTKFPADEILDPAEIHQVGGLPSNWSYLPNVTPNNTPLGYEHTEGSYKVEGERILNRNWSVGSDNHFVKMRAEATFSQLEAFSLVFVNDANNTANTTTISFTPDDLPPGVTHTTNLRYGFDIRPGVARDLVVRLLYNGGDINMDLQSHPRISGDYKHVYLKISNSTITSLSVYWTDETPGIPGILGF